jgi:hypothetical protein
VPGRPARRRALACAGQARIPRGGSPPPTSTTGVKWQRPAAAESHNTNGHPADAISCVSRGSPSLRGFFLGPRHHQRWNRGDALRYVSTVWPSPGTRPLPQARPPRLQAALADRRAAPRIPPPRAGRFRIGKSARALSPKPCRRCKGGKHRYAGQHVQCQTPQASPGPAARGIFGDCPRIGALEGKSLGDEIKS